MCSGDLSLYTFEWEPSNSDRPQPRTNTKRKCIDWEGLDSWASERKVSLDPVLMTPNGIADRVHM
jgi:hypothetical protein